MSRGILPTQEQLEHPNLAIRIPAMMRMQRVSQGLILLEMARRMETTPQTVQRLESGTMTMSLEWLDKFITALGLSSDAFLNSIDYNKMFREAEARARERVITELRETADNIEKGWK